jgi:4-hydroxybenzoate polyprenyltransferase
VLPDLIADKNTGVRALPHILGQGVSAVVIAVTATAASAVIVTQSPALPLLLGWLGLGVTAALAGSASSMALRPEPPRMVFPLLIIASLVNVVMLMLGIA